MAVTVLVLNRFSTFYNVRFSSKFASFSTDPAAPHMRRHGHATL